MSKEIVNTKAFTLLELIIVIFLLSLVSFFVVSNIKKEAIKKRVVNIASIKSLAKDNSYNELICLNSCKECFLIDSEFNINRVNTNFGPIKAYILDNTNQPIELEFGRVKDNKLCLRFIFYPNGSTSKMVIQKGDKFYYIPSFFGKIKRFDSLTDAMDYWRENISLVRGEGDFY